VGEAEQTLRIVIPYEPRPQFMPLHENTKRWSITVAHRRAGKTVAEINKLIRRALECPLLDPRFAYAAPTYGQAKDVVWNYLLRYTAPIPGARPHETELRVDLPNGARIRLYGLDNYDRLRGNYLDGIVLDEWGDSDPRAWQEVIRPALSDRRGWADFIGTPRGRNHFGELWDQAGHDEAWFRLMLRASETGLLPADELADARKAMTEEQYAAEYECSFSAGVVGAYYGREMEAAEKDDRIGKVPWDPALPVHTAWDLGIGDSTAIWCVQFAGREVRCIDYIEHSGVGIDWYVRELDKRPWKWGEHILPHDAEVKELGTGKSRVETLASLGLHRTLIVPAQRVEDGINAARLMLPLTWFDAEKCERGINALRNYRRHWDDKHKAFRDRPLHDWASHGCDAFRYLALSGVQNARAPKKIVYPKLGIV
jgi:phage terminase large subunit